MPVEVEQVGKHRFADKFGKAFTSIIEASVTLQVPVDEFALPESAVAFAEEGSAPVFRPSWPRGGALEG